MVSAVMDQVDRLRAALAGRYEVDREIGRGGMACVYRAHDRQHDRDVALKVLHPELAASIGTDRFLREIRIEARLQHPHILPLYDSGAADGLLYYVMPYVEGETLRDRIRREKQLPLADAVAIAREVADALSYAHAHGVVHRDIKPANLLLSGGHAVVADFGIARAITVAGEEALTEAGLAVGTPEYMSPEQSSGDTQVDGRSDIYALGCVLFEMLAGDPPFSGRSAQSVMARHRQDPPPSLHVVRPTIPAGIQMVVETALAKVPADRFASAAALGQALAQASGSHPALPVETRAPRDWTRPIVAAALAGLIGLATWRLAAGPAAASDPNKVMVFPLMDRTRVGAGPGAGEDVAIMIGSGLEHTEPLKWIDGWTWMDSAQRENPRLLTAQATRALSRSHGARFYIEGSIVRVGDSATVVLRLNDATADSLLSQASASGQMDPTLFPQLGARAMVGLLPALVAPGRTVDPGALKALIERRPAAVADWLQGEREYRRSQFAAALPYLRRAVGADSALAPAALRGAEAASWLERPGESSEFLAVALRNVGSLPRKYAHFAGGLADYFAGRADSAVAHLSQALRVDSSWSAAWTVLGEVYYHLIPGSLAVDSSAEAAFVAARRADPTFAPPLLHLAEIAVRHDDLPRAEALAAEFRKFSPDSIYATSLGLMLGCARAAPGKFEWSNAARRSPLAVVGAAGSLAAAAAHPACAEAGFRAALASGGVDAGERWNATLGLQSLLLAQGRRDDARGVLDSAVASGIMGAMGLYVVDAVAGAGMEPEAAKVIESLAGPYQDMSTRRLWYHGIWALHRGEVERLDTILRVMMTHAVAGSDPDTLLTSALAAHLALLRADTTTALRRLRALSSSAPRPDLASGLWESLGSERLLLAELMLVRGENAEALRVAGVFDHPQPLIYLMYLPASLTVRERAARRLGRPELADAFRRRLVALGRGDLLQSVP